MVSSGFKPEQIFMSEQSIQPGSDWRKDIRLKMNRSAMVMVLVTGNSLESDWVKAEMGAAWFTNKTLVPILLGVNAEQLPEVAKAYQALEWPTDKERVLELFEV